ncbi:MAG: FHA domain-containing protein [Actinomycetota bacterium]
MCQISTFMEGSSQGRSRVFCTNCGHQNRDDARFCAKCGRALEDDATLSFNPVQLQDEVGDEVLAQAEDLEQGQALLAVTRGPNAGSTFLVEGGDDSMSLGRNPASDIFLDDVTVSRRHADIRRRPDGLYLHDLGSLNGSYVNRERVEETKLASGDEVQIGKFRLQVFIGE